jgi:hypothetical protein
MEQLQKVIYTLEGEKTIRLSEAGNEREKERLKEMQKEREGLFHRFGDRIVIIDGQNYPETYGIVQDGETGEVKSVCPIRIKFI